MVQEHDPVEAVVAEQVVGQGPEEVEQLVVVKRKPGGQKAVVDDRPEALEAAQAVELVGTGVGSHGAADEVLDSAIELDAGVGCKGAERFDAVHVEDVGVAVRPPDRLQAWCEPVAGVDFDEFAPGAGDSADALCEIDVQGVAAPEREQPGGGWIGQGGQDGARVETPAEAESGGQAADRCGACAVGEDARVLGQPAQDGIAESVARWPAASWRAAGCLAGACSVTECSEVRCSPFSSQRQYRWSVMRSSRKSQVRTVPAGIISTSRSRALSPRMKSYRKKSSSASRESSGEKPGTRGTPWFP
jgi:hypothetical protein